MRVFKDGGEKGATVMAYANAEMQRNIIIITAMVGTMEELKEQPYMKPFKRKLGLIAKHANDIKDALLEPLDEDNIEGIKRRCAAEKLVLVNRAKPTKGMYIVNEEDMLALIGFGAEANCLGCDKAGEEIKRCKLHRTYLRCGIAPKKMERTDGGCPFEW